MLHPPRHSTWIVDNHFTCLRYTSKYETDPNLFPIVACTLQGLALPLLKLLPLSSIWSSSTALSSLKATLKPTGFQRTDSIHSLFSLQEKAHSHTTITGLLDSI
jgi:hypothetical protein